MGSFQKPELIPTMLSILQSKKGKEMKKIKGVGEGNAKYRKREVWPPLSPA